MSSASAERDLLAFDTYVADEDGVVHRFEQGAPPPAWVAELITDPEAWTSAEELAAAAPEVTQLEETP